MITQVRCTSHTKLWHHVVCHTSCERRLLEAEYAKKFSVLILAGQPLSKWLVGHRMGKNVDPAESRAVFVVQLFSFEGSLYNIQRLTASRTFVL